jgi:hypothetical protein
MGVKHVWSSAMLNKELYDGRETALAGEVQGRVVAMVALIRIHLVTGAQREAQGNTIGISREREGGR